jgi:hypothetical protein
MPQSWSEHPERWGWRLVGTVEGIDAAFDRATVVRRENLRSLDRLLRQRKSGPPTQVPTGAKTSNMEWTDEEVTVAQFMFGQLVFVTEHAERCYGTLQLRHEATRTTHFRRCLEPLRADGSCPSGGMHR